MTGPAGGFETEIAGRAGVTMLRVVGELDIATGPRMSQALSGACSAGGDRLIVDVSGLSFMDASGLRLLVSVHHRCVEEGRGLVVRGASGIVRRVFEIAGLASLLEGPGGRARRAPSGASRREVERARASARLSVADLYVDYFALGGTAELAEVVSYLRGDPSPLDLHQHDLIIHAVNEHLSDLGQGLLAYAGDGR